MDRTIEHSNLLQLQQQLDQEIQRRIDLENELQESRLDAEMIEAELKEAIRLAEINHLEAESAIRTKSQFLANINHEIRTPMNAIMGFSELLMEASVDEDTKDMIKTINTSGKDLLVLLNNLLDLAKVESGKMQFHKSHFDILKLARDIVKQYKSKVDPKKVKCMLSIDEKVPQWVIGDESNLTKVLENLLNNAVKFTEHGTVELDLSCIRNDHKEAVIQFSVSDTGIGIPENLQDKVFEDFVQIDGSATRRFGGTGLGLAICKKIVHYMNGQLMLESQPDIGSKFFFSIRLLISKLNETKNDSIDNGQIAITEQKPLNILLIDQDIDTLNHCREILQDLDHNVEMVANAKEACDLIVSGINYDINFDLIFMDIGIPMVDGIFPTNSIRQSCKTDPTIIAFVPKGQKIDNSIIDELDVNDAISKPACKIDLVKQILKWSSIPKE